MTSDKTTYTDYSPDLSSLTDLPIEKPVDREEKSEQPLIKKRKVKKPKSKDTTNDKTKNTTFKTSVSEPIGFRKSIKEFFHSTGFRLICGIFFACVGLYLLISFLSYFSTCIADQSLVNSTDIGSLPPVKNTGGEGGARLSEFLINQCFGLGSFVIIFWILAMSVKILIGRPRFKTLDFTIKCIIVLISVSLIIGLITIKSGSPVNWGGYHGRYVNDFIIRFLGYTGAVLLTLFCLSVMIMICLRDVIMWFVRLHHKKREEKRKLAAIRAAQEAKEQERLRMLEQESIEDIKAGEATSFENHEYENMDDQSMDFSHNDAPLYEMNPGEMESELSETTDLPVNGLSDNIDKTSDKPDEIETIPDSISDTTDNTVPSSEVETGNIQKEKGDNVKDTDKMVVTTGSIGESNERHFKSIVDIYESQKYKFPPFELLKEGTEKKSVDVEEQNENKQLIKKTLLDFGIPITKISATVGPTVTLYEIVPEKGVKISKIRSLVDDIAMRLAATGVRIIAPIPGKGTVGIEVANKDPQTVSMQTIIKSNKFQNSRYNLPIALGSTISNEVFMADLSKMPHLLVAGATGQGKSVGLNAILASLLYCKAPWQLKFVMIDPKKVEFSLYNKLKDYYMAMLPGEENLEPVIIDMERVEDVLNSLCIEMENRFTLLVDAHTRNVEEYNLKIKEGKLNPEEGHRYLPYIVVVVDEFADLIMTKGKSVELPIARLAQKARAVGMHVIIATQRPSTNVITGIIKTNFPARISFKVSSGVDSKIILDSPGAQHLIGRGDMLIYNNSEMTRVQCAFINTQEVENICEYVSRQPYPTGAYILPEPPAATGSDDETGGGGSPVLDRDPMFEEIARAIVGGKMASTSSIQRHYAMGYTRAGRVMDQLERAGIVGPNQGGKPRQVLVSPIELEDLLATLK